MSVDPHTELAANGRMVQVIRRFRLLSQAQLATRVEKSPAWVAAVEAGRIKLDGEELDAVARVLDTDAVTLAAIPKKAAS